MKAKKLIAILIIIILFEVFFGIGMIINYNPLKSTQSMTTQEIVITRENTNCNEQHSVTVIGVGIHEDNETGELVRIRVSEKPGRGRVFFETTLHSYGMQLQDSMQIVITAVENYLGETLGNEDLFITVSAEAHYIEGTSGGAGIAVALIALAENKTIRQDTAITGTIDDTGRIGEIAGLEVKVKTAKEYGLKKILIPKAQCPLVQDEQGINITCVGTLDEAAGIMIE